MAKKSVKSKKKGPKGKKARAKAKLERQWGEQAVEDQQASYFRGKRESTRAREGSSSDKEEDYPSAPLENFISSDHVSEDDDGDDEIDGKAVSSFVDVLRRKHRKEKGVSHLARASEDVVEMKEGESDTESQNDTEESTNSLEIEHVDPFGARFGVALEDVSMVNPQKQSTKDSRKVPLSFFREGVSLQLSKWPPLESLPAAVPASRKEWKQHTRCLWNKQRALLRVNQPRSAFVQVLYPLLATYMDICQTIPVQHEVVERTYASHILNHIWTSRQRIYQHSKEWKRLDDEDDLDGKQDPKFRDQGFTRPTVLVLMPTRGACYRFVQLLMDILYEDDDKTRKAILSDRFVTEYGPPEEVDSDPRRQAVLKKKGEEWNSFFGDAVNDDDDFKLGIALHLHEKQRPTLKLYTDFSKSDLILASPLGLKMLAARGSGVNSKDNDDSSIAGNDAPGPPDYLSSIEICWLSNAHVLMMQNWDHAMDILSWLNKRPRDTTETDFSRVRPYFLEDDVTSAAWRQMILTAPYMDPCMKAAFGRYAKSRAGTARFVQRTSWEDAALTKIVVPIKTVFQRLVVSSVQEQADARLEYFAKNVLPKIDRDQQPFTLIFIPSYLEFVSLRNYLLNREANYFVSVTEYARHTEVSRGRARFGQGRKALMLYTGRAHFFHRHSIRGVRHVIWYGLPSDPHVYQEVVGWCQDEITQTRESQATQESSVLALYTAYEAHALERIVGHSHCFRMTKGTKTTFLFAA